MTNDELNQLHRDAPVTGLATLQFHHGGLIAEPVDEVVHLVRATKYGTPGPTLCDIDRFAPGGPGWSVRGGVRELNRMPLPCKPCDEVRERDYPDLPIDGMFTMSFLLRKAVVHDA